MRIEALNRYGEQITVSSNSLMSRPLQHEVEHLYGITIIDYRKRAKLVAEIRNSQNLLG